MSKNMPVATSEKEPSYVVETGRLLDRMEKRRRWVERHLLPAPAAVRALVGYFKTRIRVERALEKSCNGRRMDPGWYVKYSPSSYLSILRFESRQVVQKFLLAALRTHARALSRRPDPDRLREPVRRSAVRGCLHNSRNALEAVGAWWIEENESSARPYVTAREREAFDLCARMRRLQTREFEGGNDKMSRTTRNFTAYLEWYTREMNEWFRKEGRRRNGRPGKE